MRQMTQTYAYVIFDRERDIYEIWGSKKRAVERCYKLAKIPYEPTNEALEGDRGFVEKVGDPSKFWLWQKFLVKR